MHHTRKNRSSKKNKSRDLKKNKSRDLKKNKSRDLKKNKSKGLKHIKRSTQTRKVRGGFVRRVIAAAKKAAVTFAQQINPNENRLPFAENEKIAIEVIKMVEDYAESKTQTDEELNILLTKYDALAVSSLKCKDDKCRAAKKKMLEDLIEIGDVLLGILKDRISNMQKIDFAGFTYYDSFIDLQPTVGKKIEAFKAALNSKSDAPLIPPKKPKSHSEAANYNPNEIGYVEVDGANVGDRDVDDGYEPSYEDYTYEDQ